MSTIIKVRCTDQVLTFGNTPVIASGGLLEDYVEFAFCSKWEGLVKTAVFWRSEDAVYHVLLDEADCCAIPREVLATEGVVFFGVFGVNDDGKQRTSEVLRYIIEKGAITEGTKPTDPTPDIYTQLLQQYAELREGKADKVAGATAGHFAALDANGNLTDSGKNKDSFVHVDTGDEDPPADDGPVLWVEPEDSETSLKNVTEKNGVIFYRNAAGQLFGIMPITKAELVEGLDVFVAEQISGQSETLLTHLADQENPHEVTAAQLGLGNVDNTADVDKPISTAVQAALNSVAARAGGQSTFQKLITGRFI